MSERLTFSLGNRSDVTARGAALAHTAAPAGAGPVPAKPVAAEKTDWAFTWTLLFTAVLFMRPQDIFPPLEALHLAEVTAAAGLIALIAGRLARGQAISRITPELVGVLLLGLVILGTAPFSIWMGGAIGVFQDLYVKVILVYLLAVNVVSSPKRLERLSWVLVLAVSYVALRAVIDYVHGDNMVAHGTRVRGSVGGIMQNPNDLALNMVSFLPLAAFFAMRRDLGPLTRVTALTGALFMVGAIVASGSRGGTIGFVVMLLIMAASTIRRRPAVVLAGVLVALCAMPVLPSSYWRRVESITDQSKDDTGSAESRKRLLGESWDCFVANPMFGVGAGNFKDWNPNGRIEAWHESHNVLLQVASELGIAGLAAMLFLIGRSFISVGQSRALLRRIRARRPKGPVPRLSVEEQTFLDGHVAAMAAAMAGWLVCAMFASVAYNWTFYYLLALAATPREILRARLPVPERVPARHLQPSARMVQV